MKEVTMISLPVPKTALGRAAERFMFVGLSAGITDVLTNSSASLKAGTLYFVLKTALDFVNKNVPNTSRS
jgi:hypothetical protein